MLVDPRDWCKLTLAGPAVCHSYRRLFEPRAASEEGGRQRIHTAATAVESRAARLFYSFTTGLTSCCGSTESAVCHKTALTRGTLRATLCRSDFGRQVFRTLADSQGFSGLDRVEHLGAVPRLVQHPQTAVPRRGQHLM